MQANAWDAGSTRMLWQLGFPAPATTSAGLAFASRAWAPLSVDALSARGTARISVGSAFARALAYGEANDRMSARPST